MLKKYSPQWFLCLEKWLIAISVDNDPKDYLDLQLALELPQNRLADIQRNAEQLSAENYEGSKRFRFNFLRFATESLLNTGIALSTRSLCPQPCSSNFDKEVSSQILTALEHFHQLKPDQCSQALSLFRKFKRPETNGYIFKDIEEDSTYCLVVIQFLQLIKIPLNRINFTSFDCTAIRSGKAYHWRKALSLNRNIRIQKRIPPNGRTDWPCQWLQVKPMFPHESGELRESYGFTHAMLMFYIARN